MRELKKVVVLYNQVTVSPTGVPEALLTEEGAEEDARLVAESLAALGLRTSIFEVNEKTVEDLPGVEADVFFNLCDGVGNEPRSEHEVPQLLDRSGRIYTGSNGAGLLLTTDKVRTKKIFEENGVPTPSSFVVNSWPDGHRHDLSFPLIVKPKALDCSLGITFDSVVNDVSQLRRAQRKVLVAYREPVLVEEYIDGREINVAVLGTGETAWSLPISEIAFGEFFSDKPKIVDFAAKWEEESENYRQTVGVCPADLANDLAERIRKLAIKAYRLTKSRDYGRVDMRLDRRGELYCLEVNLNPDISPEAGFFRSARAAGWDYPHFVYEIVREAGKRGGLVCPLPTTRVKWGRDGDSKA